MIFIIAIIICYTIVSLIKKTSLPNEVLPLISACLGCLVSVGAFYMCPEIVPTTSIGITIVGGLVSGLAATGSNQIVKQTLQYVAAKYSIIPVLPENKNNDTDKE